jgi:hypothetical protein
MTYRVDTALYGSSGEGYKVAQGLFAVANSLSEIAEAIKTLKPETPKPTTFSRDANPGGGDAFLNREDYR